jgi:hypothetical protein
MALALKALTSNLLLSMEALHSETPSVGSVCGVEVPYWDEIDTDRNSEAPLYTCNPSPCMIYLSFCNLTEFLSKNACLLLFCFD